MSTLVSVIMPSYNQRDALEVTLNSFSHQKGIACSWEVILVDDGSSDGTPELLRNYKANYKIDIINIKHGGRAVARNAAIANARGEIIIMCDCDRAVSNYFLAYHIHNHLNLASDVIVVGNIFELYFSDLVARRDALLDDAKNDFQRFKPLARQPAYAKAVYQMFDEKGTTAYLMPWIAFFSGNISLRASHLQEHKFDENFIDWGFEHFELGYRLHKTGMQYVYEPKAINFHFAHRRHSRFYEHSIKDSYRYFQSKYPNLELSLFNQFLYGQISLQEFHNSLAKESCYKTIENYNQPVYYKQLASEQNNGPLSVKDVDPKNAG